MNKDEIRGEIARLKEADTTYANCERLAILSMADNCLCGGDNAITVNSDGYDDHADHGNSPTLFSRTTVPGELAYSIQEKPMDGVLRVLQDHFDSVKALYPKEYAAVMRKIREL